MAPIAMLSSSRMSAPVAFRAPAARPSLKARRAMVVRAEVGSYLARLDSIHQRLLRWPPYGRFTALAGLVQASFALKDDIHALRNFDGSVSQQSGSRVSQQFGSRDSQQSRIRGMDGCADLTAWWSD